MRHSTPRPCRSALFALPGLLLLAPQLPAQGQGPAMVRVAPVRVVKTRDMEMVTGSLRAKRRAAVAALEPARVDEVLFQEGDLVPAGSVLVRLDRRRLVLDLAEAEARLDQSRTEIDIARAELARAQADLDAYRAAEQSRKGSVSGIVLRQAERDVAVGSAQVRAAERAVSQHEAAVARLKVRLEDTEVRAPFAARVVARTVQVGEWVSAGTPVATLVSTGTMEAWLEVPEQIPQGVLAAGDTGDPGLQIRVVTLDKTVQGRAIRVIPDVDPRSRRYFAVVDVDPGAEGALAPGMSVTAALPGSGTAMRPMVHSDAILRDGGGYYVYKVVKAKGPKGEVTHSVVPITVKIGFGRGETNVVLTAAYGLEDGDHVVIEGNERLRPMQRVAPTLVEPEVVEPGGEEADGGKAADGGGRK